VVVFGGELWPLGNAVAFVELPLADAVAAYREWGKQWESAPRFDDLGDAPILDAMARLLPLQEPYKRRLLVETTAGWTAVFDNGRRGGDPFPPTYLATSRGQRAVAATHVPESQTRFPATQFHLFGPTGEPPLMYVRTVDVGIFDEGEWRFYASGPVQPFEKVEAYRHRVGERLTREMLLDYLAALGIRADDPGFYAASVLATDTGTWIPSWTGTLDDARTAAP
jgi:hypothetical protein